MEEKKISILKKCLSSRKRIPTGRFSVYVGPERRRFVIRTESVNHPLFRALLEDAESEYGFDCNGPIHLPCEVDFFVEVMAALDDQPKSHRGSCAPFGSPIAAAAAAACRYDGYRILPQQQRFASP